MREWDIALGTIFGRSPLEQRFDQTIGCFTHACLARWDQRQQPMCGQDGIANHRTVPCIPTTLYDGDDDFAGMHDNAHIEAFYTWFLLCQLL